MSEQHNNHNQEWSTDDTQPIDVGEFQDYVDALVERDALKTRVESLEATLSDIQAAAESTKRLFMRGLSSPRDIAKFIDGVIAVAKAARPIDPNAAGNRSVWRRGGAR